MSPSPFNTQFRLDRSRTASAQVFDHLRELITTLALLPGVSLHRNDLARYYGLSSTPIRDALIRLSDENLVDIHPQQATVVRAIDLASARQAQFLRLSLELEVASQLAEQVTPKLIEGLIGLIRQQDFSLSQGDFGTFAHADMAFHRQMFAAANVEILWNWVRQQSGNLDRLRRLHLPVEGKAAEVIAEHNRLVEAIAAGDSELAKDCVREHLSGTLSQIDALRKQNPDYLDG